jgi:predicted O-linked N-acetylglucosamine transferase (SPINDLY family)
VAELVRGGRDVTVQEQLDSGISHHQAGRLMEAEKIYRELLAQQPDQVDALHLLGVLALNAGKWDAAVELIQQAIRIKPDFAEAHYNLGIALKGKGRTDDAIASYRHAVRFKPDYAEAHYNLGTALHGVGQFDEAIASHLRAVQFKPDYVLARYNLGNALMAKRQLDEAIASYRQCIRLKPDYADVHSNLGNALKDKGQMDEAIASYREAIRLKPDLAMAHNNLGNALKEIGQLNDAIACYRQAIRIDPNLSEAHSNLVRAFLYDPGCDSTMISEELWQWSRQHAEPLRRFVQPHGNNRDPDRRLRIGYVSPDFREHVVGQNLLPLLREHNHRQMEVFCYANAIHGDQFTEQIRGYADVWRGIVGLSDSQAADLIRQDRIDILVDLALHTAGNRLLIFARKPAPVQVSYLGYCSSTGLETMDYRLSDPQMDPPDSDLSVYSERTIRLPETYWCFNVGGPTPKPGPPPAESRGFITFGCLNNFAKVPPALDLWARILQSVPQSRLIVHSYPGTNLDAVRERFAGKGVSPDRLEFVAKQPWPEYVATHGRIDIALDPFPWGGGITSCNALWMGVPVVSLVGQTAVGRGGASILATIGTPELIARSTEEYLSIAVGLAKDLPRLAELRRTLRSRMQASPLMDAPRFARNIEAAYRQMWRNWCAK